LPADGCVHILRKKESQRLSLTENDYMVRADR